MINQTLERMEKELTTEVVVLEEKPVLRVHLPDLYLKAKKALEEWFEVIYEEVNCVDKNKIN